jgi:hypothetical protein
MTAWIEFTKENVQTVPEGLLGVFQLARGEDHIAYVGRADNANLRECIMEMLDKGYSHFQYANLPWTKETYEMHCRLYHHAGGRNRLDNLDHPYPPEGKHLQCPMSAVPPAMCEI